MDSSPGSTSRSIDERPPLRDLAPVSPPNQLRHLGTGRSLGERIADGVAARVGSWPFIITQTLLLGAWIVANLFLFRDWLGGRPFDPYPFILLNLLFSFQAAYTGPVIMMSQNRQGAKDRGEAEHDHKVNREALERATFEQAQSRDPLQGACGSLRLRDGISAGTRWLGLPR